MVSMMMSTLLTMEGASMQQGSILVAVPFASRASAAASAY